MPGGERSAPKRGKGPLRLWADEITGRLLPELSRLGYRPDPALAAYDGWNDQCYVWHLFTRIDEHTLAQIRIWAGISRDPQLNVDATLLRLPEPEMGDMQATEWARTAYEATFGTGQVQPGLIQSGRLFHDHLSPRARIGQGDVALHARVHRLPSMLRYPVAGLIWAVHLLTLPLLIPATLIDIRWLRSDRARSGKAQHSSVSRAINAAPHWRQRLARGAHPRAPHWRL